MDGWMDGWMESQPRPRPNRPWQEEATLGLEGIATPNPNAETPLTLGQTLPLTLGQRHP